MLRHRDDPFAVPPTLAPPVPSQVLTVSRLEGRLIPLVVYETHREDRARVVDADEQSEQQDVAPEAADGTTVVVVQPDVVPEDAPTDWSKCKASNPSFPEAARANWDLWCVTTCSQSPANCASPALTGTAACVC